LQGVSNVNPMELDTLLYDSPSFPFHGMRGFPRAGYGNYQRDGGRLQAFIEVSSNPVFGNRTLTLTVKHDSWPSQKVVKTSFSDRELDQLGAAQFLLTKVKDLCSLMSPHLYEFDPRRGSPLEKMEEDYLFDPPGFSLKSLSAMPCTICRLPFPEAWAGGNIGPVHFSCGKEWGAI